MLFGDDGWSLLCVQCISLVLALYVAATIYSCVTFAARTMRIRRILKKHFAGESGSFFFARLLDLAKHSHRIYDVKISHVLVSNYISTPTPLFKVCSTPYVKMLANIFRCTQYRLDLYKQLNFPKEKTMQDGASFIGGQGYMSTADPMVVEHMLRTDFDAFNKFPDGKSIGYVCTTQPDTIQTRSHREHPTHARAHPVAHSRIYKSPHMPTPIDYYCNLTRYINNTTF